MNYEQFKGAGDRLAAVLVASGLSWAAAKGWLGDQDVAVLAPAIIAIISFGIGVYVNRRKSIAMSASNLGDVVLTTPEIAADTPENKNIISNTSSNKKIAATVAGAKADADEVERKD